MPKKKPFPLRMDPELYEDLRRWAESEFRSMNGQIEYLLRAAVDRRLGRLGRAPKGDAAMPGSAGDPKDVEGEAE